MDKTPVDSSLGICSNQLSSAVLHLSRFGVIYAVFQCLNCEKALMSKNKEQKEPAKGRLKVGQLW
jgi:exosome complex RNA-binding protein Csl4